MLAKDSGRTAIAVLTLAVGIGANTAIFSILDPLLLRRLPVRNPDELVCVNAAGTLGLLEASEVQSFYLYRDKSPVFFYTTGGTGRVLEVRATADPNLPTVPLRDTIHFLDSSVAITSVRTLRQQADESLHQEYLVAALCSIFSLLGLVLTCVGLYGALSSSVAPRTNEIGVRMALGASTRDIFSLIVGQGLKLTVAGLLVGAAGAVTVASILASLLFGAKQIDPLSLAAVCSIFAGASFTACAAPALRAVRVDPMAGLRQE